MSVLTNTDEPTAGAGIVDTVKGAADDLSDPGDLTLDGVALGLDVLGLIANPLGGLASAGVGWLIEHLSFLKEPLDDLAGDPDKIVEIAAVWGEQVRQEIGQVATDYEQAVKTEISSWQGDAADSYRKASGRIVEQLRALESASTGVSDGLRLSGVLVATTRGIIRDLIADVVGEIIVAAAAALATSWCSFGASVGAFIGWAVARGAATAAKITGKISKMLMKLAVALNKFAKLKGAVQALAKVAKRMGDVASSLGRTAGRNGRALRAVEGQADTMKNAVTGRLPQGLRDVAENVDGLLSKRTRDGFSDSISWGNLARTGVYETSKETADADDNYGDAKEESAKGS
ncbi:hypothetical protein FPZ12_022455 [Amycolatopsis acidicola]|uniref:WXG100 family type VII secretion target n=1 Tax=Amycolatopsis acidicola TaxID=2596893 RepID=A0A5N0UY71_9PSEU|nr:hypothetical protein [Amycolatopsis acidicola]KAA9158601.1 hypothetical protein FPZ12_022455 [Amycolatopsis acidicola]